MSDYSSSMDNDDYTKLWMQSVSSLPRTRSMEWLGELLDDYQRDSHTHLEKMNNDHPVCASCCSPMLRNVVWYSISPRYGNKGLVYCCSTKCMKKVGR